MKLDPKRLTKIANELEEMGCEGVASEVRKLTYMPSESFLEALGVLNAEAKLWWQPRSNMEVAARTWVRVDRKTDQAKLRSVVYYAYALARKMAALPE